MKIAFSEVLKITLKLLNNGVQQHHSDLKVQ